MKGEWIFSWVLDGTAIQDIFICPSREECLVCPQPDGEYGTTLRMFNPKTLSWDVFYSSRGACARMETRKEDDKIVLTEIPERKRKWIFLNITEHSFRWRNIYSPDGVLWKPDCDIVATRKDTAPDEHTIRFPGDRS
jgi:hypothetical protein